MHDSPDPLDLIVPLLPRLEALGLTDVARRLAALTTNASAEPPVGLSDADLLSLAEAAELLGLRSPSTVRGMAEAGGLESYWQADGLVITRRSAEALLESPQLAIQRRLEDQLWSALGDF